MHSTLLGVFCSFLIVINGYRIREPSPVLEIVTEFPLEEANVSFLATENASLVFDNFTTTEICPCPDDDYTCRFFYLESNGVAPLRCYSLYDVHVVDDDPPMLAMGVPEPTNETIVIYNLTGPGIEMLDTTEMDPDCWLLPLDSGRAPDCPFKRPMVNDSLMIFNDTELRGGTVELYPPIGGPSYDDLGFLGGPHIDCNDYPVCLPDSLTRNKTLTNGNVDGVNFPQLLSELNETFPIVGGYFPDDFLEMAFAEGLIPSIFNDTHLIALSNIKPTVKYNQFLPRLPEPADFKFHYSQPIDVLHSINTQDIMQNVDQIKPVNRIPTSRTVLFKESKNPNKNMLAMAMDHPQTTQPPPPPSSPPSLSKPTGGKKRKKAKTTVTTSTSTVPPTSTTKKGQRKRKVTKTTTASTTSSTSVVTTRKKMKRTRTTASADS